MKDKIWAKTILTAYRYLERLADSIDAMIETKGLGSMNISGASYSCNNIIDLSEKLIELSERKIKLINLKVLTEKVLLKCGRSSATILISKYIDGKTNAEIAENNKLSLRTYFRRLNDAEEKFECVLSAYGFNEQWLQHYLSSEKWLIEIKNRLQVLRLNQEFEVEGRYINKLALS